LVPVDATRNDSVGLRFEIMSDPAGIPALVEAIRHLHGAEATWLESVPVREVFSGEVMWDGEVQVFSLTGSPLATKAYAWSHTTTGTKRQFYAVLHVPPLDSPVNAVRAAMIADAREKRN
jgi:hypothetical protein